MVSPGNEEGRAAPYGRLHDILQPALENFTQLLEVVEETPDRVVLESLHAWTRGASSSCASMFAERHLHGFVRECHGDLHTPTLRSSTVTSRCSIVSSSMNPCVGLTS